MKTDLLKKIDWEIQSKDIYVSNSYVEGKKAIVRNDNESVLGIVGKDYCPVSNEQLLHFCHALSQAGTFEFKGFDVLNKGKLILAFLENKKPGLLLNSCPMKEYLIIGNSHDGTRPFYIGTGSSLARCENQFYSTLKVFQKKHNSPFAPSFNQIQGLLRSYESKKDSLIKTFEGMENIRVNDDAIVQLMKEVHKMLASDSSIAKSEAWMYSPSMQLLQQSIYREMQDLGNNAFGLFNGVTWYTSHEMRNAGADFGKVNGTADRINQKAYKFCLNLKRISTQLK